MSRPAATAPRMAATAIVQRTLPVDTVMNSKGSGLPGAGRRSPPQGVRNRSLGVGHVTIADVEADSRLVTDRLSSHLQSKQKESKVPRRTTFTLPESPASTSRLGPPMQEEASLYKPYSESGKENRVMPDTPEDIPENTDNAGGGGSADFKSDLTPEERLLVKFRHVYAGKGGWFGLGSRGASISMPSPSVSVSATGLLNSTGWTGVGAGAGQPGVASSSVFPGSPRNRIMPRAHYERYKKEIMRKLARTLQSSEEGQGQVQSKNVTRGQSNIINTRGMAGQAQAQPHLEHPMGENNGEEGGFHNSTNITIPASWRLPVGWAARNKGYFGSDRLRLQRSKQGGRQRQHPPGLQRSVNASGMANKEPGGTLNEREQLTKNWLQQSAEYSFGKDNTGEKVEFLRIGDFLKIPRQNGDDIDSDVVPPSGIETEGMKNAPNSASQRGGETARTALTVQSCPQKVLTENQLSSKRRKWSSQTRPLASQLPQAALTVSSRKDMNMFSRMSLEAQAALKEMGVVRKPRTSGSENSLESDEVDGNGDCEDSPVRNPESVLVLKPSNNNTSMKELQRLGSEVPVSKNITKTLSGPRLKVTNVNIVDNRKNTERGAKNPITDTAKDFIKNVNNSVNQTVQKPDTDHANGKCQHASLQSTNTHDPINKNSSCKVRAGIVLRNTSTKETAITLRLSGNYSRLSALSHLPPDAPVEEDSLETVTSRLPKDLTRLPNIEESPVGSVVVGDNTVITETTVPFFGTQRQILGVGHYKVPPSNKAVVPSQWKRENTFEITPAGYDSRFEDIRTREDLDETPEEVKQRAIAKCSDWIKKYM